MKNQGYVMLLILALIEEFETSKHVLIAYSLQLFAHVIALLL